MGEKGKKDENNEVWADNERLVVKKDLGFGRTLNLEELLSPVLGSDNDEILIDLSDVRHLCSANLAVVASACSSVVHRGKKVRIVASPAIVKVLRMGGLERLAVVEEVTDAQPDDDEGN